MLATIEAICYKLEKVTILICDQRKKPLAAIEREKLLERKVDEDGNLQDYYLPTEENIKFALKMIYYAFDLSFKIIDHEGWKKLRDTIEVRHRITHPKKKSDLIVSPYNYRDASIGFNWFEQQIKPLSKQNVTGARRSRLPVK